MKVTAYIFLTIAGLSIGNIAHAFPANEYALVIGNSAYQIKPLANPINDAHLIASSLEKIGFKVSVATDLNRKSLFSTVADFTKALPKNSVALVYYAGHGLQIEGKNFLLPIDFLPTSANGVALRAYPMSDMLLQLGKAGSKVNIVVMDACRNNPFQPTDVARFRSFEGLGLAKVADPKGTLIAFSTAPGQQAEDGVGRQNSLYAAVLSKALTEPGVTAEQIFKKVAEQVRKQSLEDQQPWFESSLVNDLVFLPPLKTLSPPRLKAHPAIASNFKNDSGDAEVPIVSDPQAWYFNLTPAEWAQLEVDIQKRVDDLTLADVPLLDHRAQNGNVIAQTTLGLAYKNGIKKSTAVNAARDEASYALSLKWLHKAAAQDFPIAQVELGKMFYAGVGVEKNTRQGAFWLKEAARSDYPRALLELSLLSGEKSPAPSPPTTDQEAALTNPLLIASMQANMWLSIQGLIESGNVKTLKSTLSNGVSLSPEQLGEVYSPFLSGQPPNTDAMAALLDAANFPLSAARMSYREGNSGSKVLMQVSESCQDWTDKNSPEKLNASSAMDYTMTPMAYALYAKSKSGIAFAQAHGATDVQADITCMTVRQGRLANETHHFSRQDILQAASQ